MAGAWGNQFLGACQWLVLRGALSRPLATATITANQEHEDLSKAIITDNIYRDMAPFEISNLDSEEDDEEDSPPGVEEVESEIVDNRPLMLSWAQDVVAMNDTFLHVVLRASVILHDSNQQVSPYKRCHLPRLPRVAFERIAEYLDVEKGRRLRSVREFSEALAEVMDGSE